MLPTLPGFYQEISLDELSAVELMGKLAELLVLPANQIHCLFHQGAGGILILLSDQVKGCPLPQVPEEALITLSPQSQLSLPIQVPFPCHGLFCLAPRVNCLHDHFSLTGSGILRMSHTLWPW